MTTTIAARTRTDDVLRVAAILTALAEFYRPTPAPGARSRYVLTPLGRAALAAPTKGGPS